MTGPRRRAYVLVASVLAAPAMDAAGPTAATIAAWDAYIGKVEARLDTEATRDASLSLTAPARAALARGEVWIDDAETISPGAIDVPNGSIHHWRGRVLIPRISLDRLMAIVRDPASHTQDDVLDARLLERDEDTDRVFLKITRSSIVTAAYNTEHTVRYRTVGPTCVLSRSVATKIAELDAVGTPAEREKAPGQDRGFLWKMNAYWRYERVEDGVLVTLESATLSRDVPWLLSPVASPIVNRVARESVGRTLRAIRANAETSTMKKMKSE